MADKNTKWKNNAPGKYYVDEICIAAKFCVSVAPSNFKMDESGRHAYVFKQPQTPEEEEQVREAVSGCPVSAIGEDGDE